MVIRISCHRNSIWLHNKIPIIKTNGFNLISKFGPLENAFKGQVLDYNELKFVNIIITIRHFTLFLILKLENYYDIIF